MPLTAKGKKLKKKFREQYGDKKGDSIFYAMENSGKLKKVVKARGGKDMGAGSTGMGSGKTGGGGKGRDPSKQYTTKTNLSPQQRETLQKQQKIARGRISPSTTALGKTITYGAALTLGVPTGLTKRAIDYSPLAFGVPGTKTTKDKNRRDRDDGQRIQKVITPIEATKPVDTSLVNETDNFFKFRAYKVGGLSGGVSYGPPPKRGPNSQVPPVKLKKGGKR
jgi:hypothetical protein